MISTLDEIIKKSKEVKICNAVVAVAHDKEVLKACEIALKENIINPILIGDKEKILKIIKDENLSLNEVEIIDEKDKTAACMKAALTVKEGKASIIMKGLVDTSLIMKGILNKEHELLKGKLLSHVAVLEVPAINRLIYVSDSAMNIAPSLDDKIEIIRNCVEVAHSLGNKNPKVALLCAVEKVNKKMNCTVEAEMITEMNEKGVIKGCEIKGPLALDNAISEDAAEHKGIKHPVAGKAEILITPDIESGNILNKSMEYFSGACKASVMIGAKVPIALVSRASSSKSKLYSLALSALIASDLS